MRRKASMGQCAVLSLQPFALMLQLASAAATRFFRGVRPRVLLHDNLHKSAHVMHATEQVEAIPVLNFRFSGLLDLHFIPTAASEDDLGKSS